MCVIWYFYDMFRIAFLSTLVFAAGAREAAAWGPSKLVSREERQAVISRARLREAVDPSTRDILRGPEGEGSYAFDEEVRCKYEERDPLKPIGGHAKKFPCHDANGKRLKVKYDPSTNPEVIGEILGSRLFWALGFYAEKMYSVKIVCDNCPVDPFVSSSTPRATRTFKPATLQTRLAGTEVAEVLDEGWLFSELDDIDPKLGASRAEVDALKLLAVFVHHVDNTGNQQRLLCPADDEKCERPWMYVTDLGGTFGGRDSSTSYRLWSRRGVWKDPAKCVAALEGTDAGFRDPAISEEGRALLASLLGKLSDKQIADLFRAARVDVLAKNEPAVVGSDGKPHHVSVEDWAAAFKKKRAEIASARCPR